MVRQSEDGVDGQAVPHAEPGRVLRIVALVAMVAGLAALTAAACVLSYEPIHLLAIRAGVTPRMATFYPLIFDALLVLAGCSVLALRGAGVISRIYAWLCVLVLLAGLAGGGAVHAANLRFTRKLGGVVAAIVPWVLVLIGFGLLLALLRYVRLRRHAARASYPELPPHAPQHDPPEAVAVSRPVVPAPRPVPAADPARPTGPAPSTKSSPPWESAQAADADSTTSGQHKLPVRQAGLQWRARVPRPAPASGRPPSTAAGAVQAGDPPRGPFMPPVGVHHDPARLADAKPADAAPADEKPAETEQAAAVTDGGESAAGAEQASSSQATEPASDTESASSVSPAPTDADDAKTQGEPPAFRRERSSPTPPGEE